MISNHAGFIDALREHRKVAVRFYSTPDTGVLDRVCAPLAYGTGAGSTDGVNRYWVWDYQGSPDACCVGLVPQQILDLRVLGESFDPASLDAGPPASCAAPGGMPPRLPA